MIKMIKCVFLFMFMMSGSVALSQEKVARFALVIGNKNYQLAPLKNSINDAEAIAKNLSKLNFDVSLIKDVTNHDLEQSIIRFYQNISNRKEKKAIAVLYYAGHAIQINHRNYLVPLDVKFGDSDKFMSSLYDLNDIFEKIPVSFGLQNVFILDAWRDNPFVGAQDADSDVIISDGLAPLRAPPGTMIAYATEPGSVASDGDGKNGIYTKYLLKYIAEMITIEEVLKKVRSDVAHETNNQQIPWEHSSLLEDVFINPPKNKKIPSLITF
ncbi:MAG: caspase family protein [Emcibacteraceae bacterium]|nr:caspase family protein [Emcibacteraceae bacterium]